MNNGIVDLQNIMVEKKVLGEQKQSPIQSPILFKWNRIQLDVYLFVTLMQLFTIAFYLYHSKVYCCQ